MSDLRGDTVLVLANPRAGSNHAQPMVASLLHGLEHAGLKSIVCWERDHLSQELIQRKASLRCIVAAGGDGTVLEVLNRAPGVPIAVLPLGTENLLARHYGVTRDGESVAKLVTAGRVRHLDVGRAGSRHFCLMASAGFDAAVVHTVDRHRRGHISRLTYALPIAQTLWNYRFPLLEVEIPETGETLRGSLIFVFNVPLYGMGLPLAPGAQPDDGLLDLLVFQRPGVIHLARYVMAVVARQHMRLHDVQHRQVRRLSVRSTEPVPVQVDGDPGPVVPFAIEVAPGALSLVVP